MATRPRYRAASKIGACVTRGRRLCATWYGGSPVFGAVAVTAPGTGLLIAGIRQRCHYSGTVGRARERGHAAITSRIAAVGSVAASSATPCLRAGGPGCNAGSLPYGVDQA